jgi:hypothetical protein
MNFDIHGVRLRVETAVPDAGRMLTDRLYAYVAADGVPADLRMEIQPATRATGARAADLPKRLTWIRSRPFYGDVTGQVLALSDGDSLATVDYAARRAEIELAPATTADEFFCARTFLLLPVLELLRTAGLVYLHAAVVERNGSGVLILGRGGSGKSTLAAALLKQGWRIGGDDNALVRSEPDGTVRVHPFERELSLAPDSAAAFGVPPDEATERGKRRIRLSDLPAERQLRGAIRPTHVVRLDPAAPREPSVADLFALLVEDNPLVLADDALAPLHTATLQALLTGCRRIAFKADRGRKPDLAGLAVTFEKALALR